MLAPYSQMDRPLRHRTGVRYHPAVVAPHELEIIRRSVVMLSPGAPALNREQAVELLEELQQVQGRLDLLRQGLQRLVDEA